MNKKLLAGAVAFIIGGIVAKSIKNVIDNRKKEDTENELQD